MRKPKHNILLALCLLLILTGGVLDLAAEPANRDFTTVVYENLEEWLDSKASSAEINYIRVTNVPEEAIIGSDLYPGSLGEIIRGSYKKVFIQIEPKKGKVLKEIGDNAFYEVENLAGIELPETLTSIERRAFRDCSGLTSIDLSNCSNLTSIGEWAFSGCSGLTSIKLPKGLTSIGWSAFSETSGAA